MSEDTTGTEVATVNSVQDGEISERQEISQTAQLLETTWGGSTNMTIADFKAVAMICKEAGMSPIFDMDILGGRPYDKADFWKGLIAAHPDVVDARLDRIGPESPEWDEWVGITDRSVVACAYLATVTMRNRAMPIQEANYVKTNDAILYEYEDAELVGDKGDESKAKAKELAGDAGSIFYSKGEKSWQKKGWHVRRATHLPDWEGLAMKKCRTIVWRRVGKVCIPMEHARVMKAMSSIQQHLDAIEEVSTAAHVASPADPYGKPEEIEAKVGTGVKDAIISEADRRRMLAEASRKGLNVNDVKIMAARLLDLSPDDEVTTSQITYDLLVKMMVEIDDVPEPDHEIVVEPKPETQTEVVQDVSKEEAGPGKELLSEKK